MTPAKDILRLIENVFARICACECCKGRIGRKRFCLSLKRRRLCTKYVDDRSNWIYSCQQCYDETEEYYRERWSEYYADCL